jgi:hypothetical protein
MATANSNTNFNPLTVAELIQILQTMPQNMPVRMGMNMEYESEVTQDMVEVFETIEGDKFVYITDTPGYGDMAASLREYEEQ